MADERTPAEKLRGLAANECPGYEYTLHLAADALDQAEARVRELSDGLTLERQLRYDVEQERNAARERVRELEAIAIQRLADLRLSQERVAELEALQLEAGNHMAQWEEKCVTLEMKLRELEAERNASARCAALHVQRVRELEAALSEQKAIVAAAHIHARERRAEIERLKAERDELKADKAGLVHCTDELHAVILKLRAEIERLTPLVADAGGALDALAKRLRGLSKECAEAAEEARHADNPLAENFRSGQTSGYRCAAEEVEGLRAALASEEKK